MGFGAIGAALRLGRVSNLPTVWTSVVAAAFLSGSVGVPLQAWCGILVATTLFYVGGMYLNDAFDREIDSNERPNRPIPSGIVSARTVFASGFTMLALALGSVTWVAIRVTDTGWKPILSAATLATAIVFYNAHHKKNPISPAIMGLCRVLVYVTTALVFTGEISSAIFLGSTFLFLYLIGLTYAAKFEASGRIGRWGPIALLAAPVLYIFGGWTPLFVGFCFAPVLVWTAWTAYSYEHLHQGRIGTGVAALIAGISLVDTTAIFAMNHPFWAVIGLFGFGSTLLLHRYVPGT